MEEILHFSDLKAETFNFEENPKKPTIGVNLKRTSENLPSNVIDDVVLQVVYGNSRAHPGDENSPSRKFLRTDPDGRVFIGLWAPPNTRCKALALKLLFPSLAKHYKLPSYKKEPLHVAMAFDAFKTNELMELVKDYPGGVMRYGFFNSDDPIEAQLIAKTAADFESRPPPPSYEEKIFLQIAKENKDCFQAFLRQGPSYRSANVEVGEVDCKILFPAGYDAPPQEEQVVAKKPKKKKAKLVQQITTADGEDVLETLVSDITLSNEDAENEKGGDKEDGDEIEDNEDEEEDDEDVNGAEDDAVTEAEKATSPMQDP